MAFTALTSSQAISYVRNRSAYRNSARENLYGTNDPGAPVYYCPSYASSSYSSGYGGPRYRYGYNYDTCPSPYSNYNGNCTWWCWGRLYDTIGTALDGYGSAKNWYSNHAANGGTVATNANNINPGDIICLSDSSDGHVMFVEKVSGSTVTISQSAYSTRSVWSGMACLVTTYDKSDIYAGNTLNMYKDLDTAYSLTVVGILKTGQADPDPPTPPEPSTPLAAIIRSRLMKRRKRGRINARIYIK